MMTTMTATNPITDSKFAALRAKLRELFELDKSDLDFGIYRIMAAKNKEVTEFLDRQLKDVVRETLAEHGAGAADLVQAELDETIANLRDAGLADAQIEEAQKVRDLRARLASIGGATAAELEADIYNHLLNFFGRYYDEGDFISKRRYKGDTYAIPYSGEEVVLHWANKDQYYIKSGEWHKDYRFKVGGKTARVRLLQATQEAGNNKEADDAKRRFILCANNPVDAANTSELVLHFEFRAPTDEEKKAVAESEATRIFGGDYDKTSSRKKGDEREQFAAYAEQVALGAMPDEWKTLLSKPAPTPAKPNRTILGKHLDDFTARNTFDYFIHKDLGGFLKRELDFYIKNEVVRLDDLEALDEGHLLRVQGRIKAIRRVAGRIIGFLAAIEDFQKKLWLKKKFVLNTNWLVTIDRVPDRLRDIVAENQEQWAEWERLGFKQESDDASGLFENAEWGTRAYLDACDKLVVDTRFFDANFKTDLLASEEVLGGAETIEEAMIGLLINSDNSQAIRLLANRYRSQIDCVYIDPPYNTVHSKIAYKNQFEHGSWLSLLANPFDVLPSLWKPQFSFGIAIDDYEHARLAMMIRNAFPQYEHSTIVVNHHPQGSGGRLSRTHEYYMLLSPVTAPNYLGEPLDESVEDRPFMRSGTADNNWRHGRPNSFYALLYDREKKQFVGIEPPPPREATDYPTDDTDGGLQRVYPLSVQEDGRVDERVWRSSYKTGAKRVARGEIFMTARGAVKQRIAHGASRREVVFSNWTGADFNAGTNGTAELERLGLGGIFDYPKSVKTLERGLWMQSFGAREYCVLDYFAGSGTTGHAVINMLRKHALGLTIRMVLVEMGEYFDTVLKQRIAKTIYSDTWLGGQAQIHDNGISALFKYFSMESYEDALNNLPAPERDLLNGADDATRDALITYALDLELGPHLLNLDIFRDPWGYEIEAQLAGEDEITPHRVDLVETFNYLLGLKVTAYGPIERYSAEFERAKHDDGLGRFKVKGRLRRDPEGAFVYQRVEGVLNDGNDTRVLVIWRKLTDDPEQDAAALDAWMARHRESTRERSEHRDYHRIYVNGPVTLAQPTQEIRTVFPIEQTFKDRMFESSEGGV